jgi:hypothetical protein
MAFVFFVVLVLAALVIFFVVNAEAQNVTGKSWTVTFMFKQKQNEPEPEIRLYVLVDGKTEGEAAINGHKALSEKLTAQATDRLIFLEAQQKR